MSDTEILKDVPHYNEASEMTASEASILSSLSHRIIRQGPWNQQLTDTLLRGPPALPMPVKIAESVTLAPVFRHLEQQDHDVSSLVHAANDEGDLFKPGVEPYYEVPLIEYEKGVIYLDRRLDLCKMVVGPLNIGRLMESLENNQFIKHFLLGNNIIGPVGARHLADFITRHPDRMDTWYLAGNCIDGPSFHAIAQALKSSQASNIWLKRNPLGPDAVADLVELLTSPGCPRTLDLDQTEISDGGVASLFDRLTAFDGSVTNLQHLYLDGNGIGPQACKSIATYLSKKDCSIKSLYLSVNPIGDAGATALAEGLRQNQSLERLLLSSIGLTSMGAAALLEALSGHPLLYTLDLGQNYATNDLEAHYNYLSDNVVSYVCNFINQSTTLKYLSMSYTMISHRGLRSIEDAILQSHSLCYAFMKSLQAPTGTNEIVEARKEANRKRPYLRDRLQLNVSQAYNGMSYDIFLADEKRWLLGPKDDLRKIDSVYRNKDTVLARRGSKRLNKWWKTDDPTLEAVMAACGIEGTDHVQRYV